MSTEVGDTTGATICTGSYGSFIFDNVALGTYRNRNMIKEQNPGGLTDASYNDGDDAHSVTDTICKDGENVSNHDYADVLSEALGFDFCQ